MVLGLTQSLIKMSIRNLPRDKARPARKADNPTTFCEPIVYKMWGPRRLPTLWASTACYRANFIRFFYLYELSKPQQGINLERVKIILFLLFQKEHETFRRYCSRTQNVTFCARRAQRGDYSAATDISPMDGRHDDTLPTLLLPPTPLRPESVSPLCHVINILVNTGGGLGGKIGKYTRERR
jgi:hypothetical protein